MRIPQPGDRILYVFKAADPGDKLKAIIRAGTVVSIDSYDADSVSANIAVKLNGEADAHLTDLPKHGLEVLMAKVGFDADRKVGTWHWPAMIAMQCVNFKTLGPITHGRETIKKGVLGMWDQMENTITFKREDVENLHADFQPVYTASDFIDLHCARLLTPEGFAWNEQYMARKDDTERACERENMMTSMRFRNERAFEDQHQALLDLLCRKIGLPGYPASLTPPPELWQWDPNWKSREQWRREQMERTQLAGEGAGEGKGEDLGQGRQGRAGSDGNRQKMELSDDGGGDGNKSSHRNREGKRETAKA